MCLWRSFPREQMEDEGFCWNVVVSSHNPEGSSWNKRESGSSITDPSHSASRMLRCELFHCPYELKCLTPQARTKTFPLSSLSQWWRGRTIACHFWHLMSIVPYLPLHPLYSIASFNISFQCFQWLPNFVFMMLHVIGYDQGECRLVSLRF